MPVSLSVTLHFLLRRVTPASPTAGVFITPRNPHTVTHIAALQVCVCTEIHCRADNRAVATFPPSLCAPLKRRPLMDSASPSSIHRKANGLLASAIALAYADGLRTIRGRLLMDDTVRADISPSTDQFSLPLALTVSRSHFFRLRFFDFYFFHFSKSFRSQ